MLIHFLSAERLELEIRKSDPELMRLLVLIGCPDSYVQSAFVTISFEGVDENEAYTKITEDISGAIARQRSQQDLFSVTP